MANESTDDPRGTRMHQLDLMVVVADTSGSMREHGKAMLARNLVSHIRELARLGDGPPWLGEPILVRWSSEVEVVKAPPDQDLPAWIIGGRAQAQPLLSALDGILVRATRTRILLLSDGHFASADVDSFKAWQRRHPDVSTRALGIGPDAATATLAKVTERGGVFPAEEIVLALASWTLPQEQPLPSCIADIASPDVGTR
jgi:hypothetical protein